MSDIRNSGVQAPLDNIIYVPSSACIPIWNHSRAIGRNSRYNVLVLSCNLNTHSQLPRSFCEKTRKSYTILHKNPKFYEIARSARNRMCCKSIVSITILSNITFALSYLDKFIKIAKIFERKFYIWDQMGNLMLQHVLSS